ncbi:hypothetical protein LIER_38624 [Lithospermum erythrorhizon]|uniref:Uncharacterized protein n=1 Tax=Lithospermum erythrorhizon TaxID=34254 RepID=A0AAV3Q2N6_LITER
MARKAFIGWRIGDGRSIDIWREPWVPRVTDFLLRGERGKRPCWVSQFIWGGEWIREVVEDVLDEEDVSKVLVLPISCHGLSDKLI